MMAISDGVVIGVVLGLIFTAVCYYLYNRQSQLERKVGLMENILLDLKVTTEQTLLSATEPQEPMSTNEELTSYREAIANGASESVSPRPPSPVQSGETREVSVEQASRTRTPPGSVHIEREQTTISNNYESMTYKELQQLAKQRGISGLRNVSKAQVIEALRNYDNGGTGSTIPLTNWNQDSSETQSTSVDKLESAHDDASGLAPLDSTEPEKEFVSSD
jgi:hypothetical protein